MKCHYEVLEVSRNADDSEIKTAYRKLALKWHPDKNLEDVENAKEQFQSVQQAYEILSDRQERAWYDSHREQILRGSDSEFVDKCVDVFQYFTTSCFKGYSDSENGFYAVYRNIFSKIAEEDIEFMDDREEFCEIPSFGWSTSNYDEIVGPFYAYWTSYNTKKSFVWLDLYNAAETRNRRVFKMMEKENKKVRQKAKQDRNEEIRALVAFVRKRDKRVQEHSKVLEAKILENRQKQEEISRAKRLERRKELEQSKSEAEWTKFDNVKVQLQEIEKRLAKDFGEEISNDEEDDDSYSQADNLYCPACNKLFKTTKAFQNHETSKKHKENVEKLKESIIEDENLNSDNELNSLVSDAEENKLSASDAELEDFEVVEALEADEDVKTDKKENNSKKLTQSEGVNDIISASDDNGVNEEESELVEEFEDFEEVKTKKKQKKSKKVMKVGDHSDHETDSLNDTTIKFLSDSESDFDFSAASNKKQKRKNKRNKGNDKNSNTSKKEVVHSEAVLREEVELNNDVKIEKGRPSKRGKEKRSKREEQESLAADIDVSHCCVLCKANFQSKNKLFDHLKKTGHGVYLPQNVKSSKAKKNSVK